MTEEEITRLEALAEALSVKVAKAVRLERLYADYLAEPIWNLLDVIHRADQAVRKLLLRRTSRIAASARTAQDKIIAAHRAREAVKALVK